MNRTIRVIHRITGMIGSVIVLVMALTGILLNHRSIIGYSSETSMKLQKVIFGIHSGTIGNLSVIWITDIGAICMIVLSLTGIFIWFKSKPAPGSTMIKGMKRRNE
ncbi:hypothetical protein ACQCN2_19525 [Brevibacillus ginsengisoli]|uniref:hypothetical protein n=1 Tax=Brevibacillus ginsengisoli TaxID=363854 RepID=UPI003CF690FA